MNTEVVKILSSNCLQIFSPEELQTKLKELRPLRVKFGIDPTTPDIHLGHTIALTKLRQFQEAGHESILVIGDFTARIGDPSNRSATRKQLSHEEVLSNALTYQKQAAKILDQDHTRIVYNSRWFERMSLEKMLRLNSHVTIQQILQREDFRHRIKQGLPVRFHEIQYPLFQGWDSVEILADIELGGTDQLFNLMMGRHLQKEEGQPQQVAMLLPILEGLDGVQKMSKSLNNAVGILEPPETMFGKLMSIPDAITDRYYKLLLLTHPPSSLTHPMEIKRELARRIVSKYHSQRDAEIALNNFNLRFSKRSLESVSLPCYPRPLGGDLISIIVSIYSKCFGMQKSRGEVRRLIEQGSVQWKGEKVSQPHAQCPFSASGILKLDRTHAVFLE